MSTRKTPGPIGSKPGGQGGEPSELVALSDVGLKDWARAHPDDAVRLAGRGERAISRLSPMHPARVFHDAVAGLRPGSDRADVRAVSSAWHGLSAADRALLTVEYPGLIGPLNGVPFEARSRANHIVVVAALRLLEQRARVEGRRAAGENRNALTRLGGRVRALMEPPYVRERRRDLARMLPGFRHAVEHATPHRRLLLASTAGRGRFVVIDGEISADTRSVTVFVPGTFTDANSLRANMDRLSAVDGRDVQPDARVGVYWAGGDFPSHLMENGSARYALGLRPSLAAFDAALDLEVEMAGAVESKQVYIGHSFGAAAIGAAESRGEGLTADVVVYAGAPGAGFGITGPQDTVNQDAPRYALVADGDLSPAAGHALFGKVMGAAPLSAMRVQRLSTGFLDHAGRRGRLRDHDDYLLPGSTSALNIRAVVLGLPVLPWLGKGGSDEELAAKIDAAEVPW